MEGNNENYSVKHLLYEPIGFDYLNASGVFVDDALANLTNFYTPSQY
jgi:hypothetical protein